MKVHIVTLFPEIFKGAFDFSLIKRAKEKGVLEINISNLRDFALNSYGTVDDKPYGGGTGMLLMCEPIFNAVEAITQTSNFKKENSKVVLLTPRGKKLNQEKIKEFSKLDEVILICGRYEGVDERVSEKLVDEEISVGDYILSGAEIPAMIIVDSVTRLLPGVLEKSDATTNESFENGLLEHPQYTRPEDFRGLKVPDVLLSGNHEEIKKWRNEEAKRITKERRPDL